MILAVDLAKMFPDFDQAEGEVDEKADLVKVTLYRPGQAQTISLRLSEIYNGLELLRASVKAKKP